MVNISISASTLLLIRFLVFFGSNIPVSYTLCAFSVCVRVCVFVGLSLRSQQPHACAFETQLKRFTASTCG